VLVVGSVGASCEGDDAVCVDDDSSMLFDVFTKWIDDRSLEGQKFLEQLLLEPSSGDKRGSDNGESKYFFDEIKDAFASGTQTEEENVETKIWKGVSALKDVMGGSIEQFISDLKAEMETGTGDDTSNAAFEFATCFQTFFSAKNSKEENEESRKMAAEFIQKASDLSQYLQGDRSTRGFLELYDITMKALGEVTKTVKRNFGRIHWHRLKPFSIIYFLEYMESLFTPSWKRRAHAFAPEVSVEEVIELHKALYLANLAYLNSIEEIKAGLQEESSEWELIYAQLKTAPWEPAHYIALRKDQPLLQGTVRHNSLDVLLVVRGTKDFANVLSDGLLDAVEFRGGYGHAGLVQSGQFLVDHHIDLLHSLLKMVKKEKIKLTIIGHSLGAGAATIAAIIFNEDEKAIDANVVGFGCPALLSKELSESASPYVTTIISDSDMIPRLSGPTLVNAVFDIMSYDWIERGLSDLRDGLHFLRSNLLFDISSEQVDSVYDYIKNFLETYIRVEIEEMAKAPRKDVVLIPPGRCTHFYRDGNGVTGQQSSCEFFDSLEMSRTMIDDHMIGIGYNRMLLDYMRHRLQNYQFTFEQTIV